MTDEPIIEGWMTWPTAVKALEEHMKVITGRWDEVVPMISDLHQMVHEISLRLDKLERTAAKREDLMTLKYQLDSIQRRLYQPQDKPFEEEK